MYILLVSKIITQLIQYLGYTFMWCILFLQNSATYWEGKSDAETLQRIYGISFPDNKQLKEWQKFQEEAAKRDHRKIGRVSLN